MILEVKQVPLLLVIVNRFYELVSVLVTDLIHDYLVTVITHYLQCLTVFRGSNA